VLLHSLQKLCIPVRPCVGASDALAGTVTKGRLGIDMLAAAISAQFIR